MRPIIFVFLSFILNSCSVNDTSYSDERNAEKLLEVYYNRMGEKIYYQISNNGNKSAFIPIKFTVIESGDSLIFGVLSKSDIDGLVSYNAFMPPLMQELKKNYVVEDSIEISDNYKKRNYSFYFRIFNQDYISYIGKENKYNSYVTDFISFEKKKSYLVKAELKKIIKEDK